MRGKLKTKLVKRIRSWEQAGTTLAHGKLFVHPTGKACAVDYGIKVRFFWRRDQKWVGKPALPHQYSRKKDISTNTESAAVKGGNDE
jgi:hypothetical protein